ncbi:MAG: hypothetical protein KBG85_05175 [Micropruina sp.]|nr:hypothetical protein [Micropruina sp.]
MSARNDIGQSVLQAIFSVFLGLVVTAFVGIGVNTFLPEPDLRPETESVWSGWRLTTSIVLLVCATAVMLLSLAVTRAGAVLANGALLGGLFTMIYAVGMGVSTANQWPRFAVMTAALVITVGVGWWRFSRGRRAAPRPSGGGELSGEAEERLASVERRLDALARALRD